MLVEEPEERATDDVIAKLDEAMSVRAGLAQLGDQCQEVLDRFFCESLPCCVVPASAACDALCIGKLVDQPDGHLR